MTAGSVGAALLMSTTELTFSQRAILEKLPERFAPERIDHVWIFPPHFVGGRESGLVVLSLLAETDGESADYRTLVTCRYEAERVKGRDRYEERVTEEGSAPPTRIERVIAGVLARSGADAAEPITEQIGGDPARWTTFLEQYAVATPLHHA